MTTTPDDGAQAPISDEERRLIRDTFPYCNINGVVWSDLAQRMERALTAETAAREKAEANYRELNESDDRLDQALGLVAKERDDLRERLTSHEAATAAAIRGREKVQAERDAAVRECERLRDANRRHAFAHYRRRGDTDSLHAIGEERDEELESARDERDAAIRERDEWKANHDTQRDIKRAVLVRADLPIAEHPERTEFRRTMARLESERDELRAKLAASQAELDNPEWDGTDAAHPAWWRGEEAGVAGAALRWREALTDPYPKAGAMCEPLESCYRDTEKVRAERDAHAATIARLREVLTVVRDLLIDLHETEYDVAYQYALVEEALAASPEAKP